MFRTVTTLNSNTFFFFCTFLHSFNISSSTWHYTPPRQAILGAKHQVACLNLDQQCIKSRKYTKGLKTRGLEFSTSAIYHYGNNPSNIPIKLIGNLIKLNWCMDNVKLPSHGAIIRMLPQAQLLQCFAPHGFDMTINDLCRLWHRHDITAAMCRRLCTLVVMWWVTRSMFVENKHTYFH